MYRFWGLSCVLVLVAACQPAGSLQTTAPQNTTAPQKTTATGNEIVWKGDVITPLANQTTGVAPRTIIIAAPDPERLQATEADAVIVVESNITTEATDLDASQDFSQDFSQDDANPGIEVTPLPVLQTDDMALAAPVGTLEDALAKVDDTEDTGVAPIEQPVVLASLHPEAVVGQTMADLGRNLGLPNFERSDAEVMIWQYRLSACVADFFLYLNGEDYVVTGWAWRAPIVGAELEAESCIQQLGMLVAENA